MLFLRTLSVLTYLPSIVFGNVKLASPRNIWLKLEHLLIHHSADQIPEQYSKDDFFGLQN